LVGELAEGHRQQFYAPPFQHRSSLRSIQPDIITAAENNVRRAICDFQWAPLHDDAGAVVVELDAGRNQCKMSQFFNAGNSCLPTRFFSGRKYLLSAAVTSAVSLQYR
jgi:hypothetical protein